MTCRQCGAVTAPGMTECPNCGAQLSDQNSFAPEPPRPPKQQRYIPGGGASAASSAPQQPSPQPSSPGAPRRPQGSLGRRLAQQGAPQNGEDVYPPPPQRGSDAQRRGANDNYPPRGSRSRPDDRDDRDRDDRDDRGRGARGRGYDDGRDDGGRSRGSSGRGRDYDEGANWNEGRGRGSGARRSRDRGGSPGDDASEEMIARREPSRSGPRRRPENQPEWTDEYGSPLDDPRAPPGMGGSNAPSGRRTSGQQGSSRGRGGVARYDSEEPWDDRDGRRYDSPPGYTDEAVAAHYDDSVESQSYSEEFEARPRYPDERRRPSSGSGGRSSRSAPGSSRGRGYRDDERDGYDGYGRDDGYGRPGPRSGAGGREMGRYPDVPDYDDVARGYPPLARGGGQAGYDQRGDYEESNVWQPGGGLGGQVVVRSAPRGRTAGGARTTSKPRKSILPMAFQLLVIVVVVVGLVAVVGPDVAPKLGKYLPFLRTGAQATQPPVFATYTPGPTPTLLPNNKLFSNAAGGFIMDYPTSWGTTTVTGANNDVIYQFTQPNSATLALIERNPEFDSATNEALVQAEVAGAQTQGITMTEITSAATTEGVGGEVWTRREFQATKGGVKLHIAVLACHHLGKGFVIALISSDTGFSTDDTATFEPMLRSFRFL